MPHRGLAHVERHSLRGRFVAWRARTRHALRHAPLALPILAALAGVAAGLTVALLHESAKALHEVVFDLPPGVSLSSGAHVDWRRVALMPIAIGLLTGIGMTAMRRLWPEETVDPIEANALFGGKMSFWSSVRLVVATLGANAAGAAVGMEAAYSQIGAAIFSSLGQRLKLRRGDLRLLTAAGAGGAIAAAFNAPLAGAFYAFELVLGSYTLGALGPVCLAVVTATLTLRETLGDEKMFALPHVASAVQLWEYAPFAAIGLAAGLLGIGVMQLVTLFDKLLRRSGTPAWARPAVGGLVVGMFGLVAIQALGSGHGAIRADFAMNWPLAMLAMLLTIKILACAASLGAGFRGGLFSTSLLMGGLLGALAGRLIATVIPLSTAHLQTFSLVGMGAMGTAIIGAPITMTALTLETTGDAVATFGVLTGVVVASTLVRQTFGYSFATWRFHLRGVAIRGAHDVGWLDELTVGRLMDREPHAFPQTMPLADFRRAAPLGSAARAFLVDDEGRYVGAIEIATAHDRELDDAATLLVVGEMAHGGDWALTVVDPIRAALTRFGSAETDILPVVESSANPRLIGTLREAHALRRFAEEMQLRRSDELGEPNVYSDASE
ncbi:MAG: chloride channel protein [Roseiarcus sp.]